MIDQRAVWAAEQSVAARKATLAAQWAALRTRTRQAVTQPSTIGAIALVGGIIGWRSAAAKVTEEKCSCPEKPPRPSLLNSGMRALAVGTLQAVASIASEELLRGTVRQTTRDQDADTT